MKNDPGSVQTCPLGIVDFVGFVDYLMFWLYVRMLFIFVLCVLFFLLASPVLSIVFLFFSVTTINIMLLLNDADLTHAAVNCHHMLNHE